MAPSSSKPVPATMCTTHQTVKAANTLAAPSTAATTSKQKKPTTTPAPASVKAAKPVPSKSASSNTKPKGTTAQKATTQKAAETVTNKTSTKATTNNPDETTNDEDSAANGLWNTSSNLVSSNNPDSAQSLQESNTSIPPELAQSAHYQEVLACLAESQAEIDRLKREQSAADISLNTCMKNLIPPPPKQKNIKLQCEMCLANNNASYSAARAAVQGILHQMKIWGHKKYSKLTPEELVDITNLAKDQVPLFSRYEGGWPVLEIVRTSLKNECGYAAQRSQGIKKSKTTSKVSKRTKSTRDTTPSSNSGDNSTSSNKDKDGDNDNTSEAQSNNAMAPADIDDACANDDAAPLNDSDAEGDQEEDDDNEPVPDLGEQPFNTSDDKADDGEQSRSGNEEEMEDDVDEGGDLMDVDSAPRMSEKAKGKRQMPDPEEDEEEQVVVESAPKKQKSRK